MNMCFPNLGIFIFQWYIGIYCIRNANRAMQKCAQRKFCDVYHMYVLMKSICFLLPLGIFRIFWSFISNEGSNKIFFLNQSIQISWIYASQIINFYRFWPFFIGFIGFGHENSLRKHDKRQRDVTTARITLENWF